MGRRRVKNLTRGLFIPRIHIVAHVTFRFQPSPKIPNPNPPYPLAIQHSSPQPPTPAPSLILSLARIGVSISPLHSRRPPHTRCPHATVGTELPCSHGRTGIAAAPHPSHHHPALSPSLSMRRPVGQASRRPALRRRSTGGMCVPAAQGGRARRHLRTGSAGRGGRWSSRAGGRDDI